MFVRGFAQNSTFRTGRFVAAFLAINRCAHRGEQTLQSAKNGLQKSIFSGILFAGFTTSVTQKEKHLAGNALSA